MRVLILVILVSVVSAQTFFNTDRRGYRTSNNFRRQSGNGATSGSAADTSAVTQLKETPDSAGAYPPQEQTQLPDGATAGGAAGSGASGVPADDDAAPDAPDAADDGADVPPADDAATGGTDADQPDDSVSAGGVAAGEGEKDPNDLTWLRNAIRGEPGTDYPILSEIPKTAFKCSEEPNAGYYGDPEARCQVFHICQKPDDRMDSFLCPNGTIFSQRNFVCVWWWQYDCSQSEKDYALNANLYAGGETGYGQSNAVDAAAGGVTYADDNSADTASGGADGNGAVTSPMLTGTDLPDVPAAGGADDPDGSPVDPVTDGAVAPAADPVTDDGSVDDTADDVAAGGAVTATDGSVTPAGKTNVASPAAVRRRLKSRSRSRFGSRTVRRNSRRRSSRRGLRSRNTARRGGRSSFRRPASRTSRNRNAGRRAGRRTLVSRRNRRNRN